MTRHPHTEPGSAPAPRPAATVTVNAGDFMASDADWMVIPADIKGRLQPAHVRWLEQHRPYALIVLAAVVKEMQCRPGWVFVVHTSGRAPTIAFAFTRPHQQKPARIEWIAGVLAQLAAELAECLPTSVAIPALGCGAEGGGLDWNDVWPLIEGRLASIDVRAEIYEPPSLMAPLASRLWAVCHHGLAS